MQNKLSSETPWELHYFANFDHKHWDHFCGEDWPGETVFFANSVEAIEYIIHRFPTPQLRAAYEYCLEEYSQASIKEGKTCEPINAIFGDIE